MRVIEELHPQDSHDLALRVQPDLIHRILIRLGHPMFQVYLTLSDWIILDWVIIKGLDDKGRVLHVVGVDSELLIELGMNAPISTGFGLELSPVTLKDCIRVILEKVSLSFLYSASITLTFIMIQKKYGLYQVSKQSSRQSRLIKIIRFILQRYYLFSVMKLTQKALILTSRKGPQYFQHVEREIIVHPEDTLVQVQCFSIDPIMRLWAAGIPGKFRRVQIGQIANSFSVGKVIQVGSSCNFKKDSYVFGNLGTTNYSVLDEQRMTTCLQIPQQLLKGFTTSQFLYLINHGVAAYACLDVFEPGPGKTAVVSSAAGATGILACQLLKARGCKVIGLTSSPKMEYVKKYADLVVDYQNRGQLKRILSQNPFQFYFDNVGEWMLDVILSTIKPFGRIALCGAIANYNDYSSRGIYYSSIIISKRLKMVGINFAPLLGRLFDIFQQYRGMKFEIKEVEMKEFKPYFKQIFEQGTNIYGKIIVKMNHSQ